MTNLQKMIADIYRGDPQIYGDITTNEMPQLLTELAGNSSVKLLSLGLSYSDGRHWMEPRDDEYETNKLNALKTAVTELGNVLSQTQITSIKLKDIGSEALLDFIQFLPQTPQITSLTLGDPIGHLNQALLTILSQTQITSLELYYIGSVELEDLVQFLPTSKITKLELIQPYFFDDEFERLTKALPNTQITELNLLATNKITSDGVLKLFEIMPNTKIDKLAFSGLNLSNSDINLFANALIDYKIAANVCYYNYDTILPVITKFIKSTQQERMIDLTALNTVCNKLIKDGYDNALQKLLTTYHINPDIIDIITHDQQHHTLTELLLS